MIGKYLDCSTAHLTNELFWKLADGEVPYIVSDPKSMKGEVLGLFVHVPEGLDEEEEKEIPQELNPIIDYARKNGCWWIQFDRDGEIIDGLPVYTLDEKNPRKSVVDELYGIASNVPLSKDEIRNERLAHKRFGSILGKLYDAQDAEKPVNIRFKDQILTGMISIVQVRNETFEIETENGTVAGSIWDISEVSDVR